MRGREHIGIGAGSVVVVVTALQMSGHAIDNTAMALSLVAAAAGSLGPDLDHPGSLASLSIPASLVGYSGLFLLSPWVAARHPALSGLDLSSMGPAWTTAAWSSLGLGLLLFSLSWVFGATFGHRGPVHSVVFGVAATVVVLAGLVFFSAPLWLALPFAWGWLAHLLADSTTAHGLQYAFWPLGNRLR